MQKYIIPQRRHCAASSDSFAVLDEHLSSPAATRPPAARLRPALHDRTNIPTNVYLPPAVRKESAQPGGCHVLQHCARPEIEHGSGLFCTAPHSTQRPYTPVSSKSHLVWGVRPTGPTAHPTWLLLGVLQYG